MALEWDSVNYVSVADSLLTGEGFTQVFRNEPYVRWPPLWPLLLAAAAVLSPFDPLDAAGPINAAAFALTAFAGGWWLRRRLASRFLAVWGALALALAIPLAREASWAMTEAVFALCAVLALTRLEAHLREGDRPSLLWAAAFAALACLTRYAGLALVAAAVPLLLLRPGPAPSARVRGAAAYALIALAPVGLWMARNLALGGGPLGRREPPRASLPEAAGAFLEEIGGWSQFPIGGVPAAALAALALLALAAAVALGLARAARDPEAWRERAPLFAFGGFALVYLAVLAVSASTTLVWPLGGRHLAPAYAPLLLAAAWGLDRLARSGRLAAAPPRARTAAAAVLALWLCWSAVLHARDIARANEGVDRGLATPEVARSELLRHVRESPIGGVIVTNHTPLLYLHNEARAEYVFLPYALERAAARIAEAPDGAYVVWFRANVADRDYRAPELRALPDLAPVAELEDGAIFRVRRGAANGG